MGKVTRFVGVYTFLSNFYPVPVIGRNGWPFPSVEHAYQASKPPGDEAGERWAARIRDAPTPGAAKKLGRKCPVRDDWTTMEQLAVMYGLLVQKFDQDWLKAMLLETGDAEIVEGNTWGDTFWGRCGGVGDNHLGEMLMGIRDAIRGSHDNRNSQAVVPISETGSVGTGDPDGGPVPPERAADPSQGPGAPPAPDPID